MIRFNHEIKPDPIYEGLIVSYIIDTTIDMLEMWCIANDKFSIKKSNNGKKIILKFKSNLTKRELDNLLQLVNTTGWYVANFLTIDELKWRKFNSDIFEKDYLNKKLLAFQLEAKFDREMSLNEYNILYHVSRTILKEKILKIGLVPKAKEKISSHPDRVYLAANEQDAMIIANQFYTKDPNKSPLSLFRISFKEAVKNNPTIRLFDDPNFQGALYTLTNIPPKFVEFVRDIPIQSS